MAAKQLLESKKFLASVLASLIAFLCLRFGLSQADTAFVVGPLIAFIGAQAFADIGKSRAELEAVFKPNASPAATTTVNITPQPPEGGPKT